MNRIALSLAVAACVSSPALGQSMRPLLEIEDQVAAAYPPARCGGLYQAMMEWAGRDRLGEDLWESTDTARQSAILLSAMIAQSLSGGELEDRLEVTIRDVRNIADLYLHRFEQNYAATGQAFNGDLVTTADMQYCGALVRDIDAALR